VQTYRKFQNTSGGSKTGVALTIQGSGTIQSDNWYAVAFDTTALADGLYNFTYNYTDYADTQVTNDLKKLLNQILAIIFKIRMRIYMCQLY